MDYLKRISEQIEFQTDDVNANINSFNLVRSSLKNNESRKELPIYNRKKKDKLEIDDAHFQTALKEIKKKRGLEKLKDFETI